VLDVERRVVFAVRNLSQSEVKLTWNTNAEEFTIVPRTAHVEQGCSKQFLLAFRSSKTAAFKDHAILCETKQIKQADRFVDWDDSMTYTRYVSNAELNWVLAKREEERKLREE
jgi:hypothetical protein